MTDKNDLIRIMEVYEDTTGAYKIGEIDYCIFTNEFNDHLKKYGKKDLVKKLKCLIEYINKQDKIIKKANKK
jgi:hypothetical protein